jgi:hypothetical protein
MIRGEDAGDVMRAQADGVQPVPEAKRLLPEGDAHRHALVGRGKGIVDQHVEAALLLLDAPKDRLDLRVVGVITGHGDAPPAEPRDLLGRLRQCARPAAIACAQGPTGEIDGGAHLPEPQRDAFADASTGTLTSATVPTMVRPPSTSIRLDPLR